MSNKKFLVFRGMPEVFSDFNTAERRASDLASSEHESFVLIPLEQKDYELIIVAEYRGVIMKTMSEVQKYSAAR